MKIITMKLIIIMKMILILKKKRKKNQILMKMIIKMNFPLIQNIEKKKKVERRII